MTPQPPVAPSYNPATVNVFVSDYWAGLQDAEALYLREMDRYEAYLKFLNDLRDYKLTSEQRIANGLPLGAQPVPPPGFSLPAEPPPPVKPVHPDSIVQPKSVFGVYPAPGDTNLRGRIIDNPFLPGDEKLVKVVDEGPFGASHYWIDAPAGSVLN